MTQELNVIHNEDEHCFEVFIKGYRAYLDYRPLGGNQMDYCHTFVPEDLRGKGVAAVLTRAALDYAKQNNLEVIPSCVYVESFVKKHGK